MAHAQHARLVIVSPHPSDRRAPQRAASKLRARARVQRGACRPVMRAAEDSACRH